MCTLRPRACSTAGGERRWQIRPKALDAFAGRSSRLAQTAQALEGISLQALARRWTAALDRAGVETGFFIAIGEGNEELAEFLRLTAGRAQAWGSVVEPLASDAPAVVRRFQEWGLRGLKLYPPIQRFSASDRAIYPLYEAAAEQGLAVLFHLGITIAPIYDLRYADPLHLSAASRDFPEVTFAVAHCGAGFLRERCSSRTTPRTSGWTRREPTTGATIRRVLRRWTPSSATSCAPTDPAGSCSAPIPARPRSTACRSFETSGRRSAGWTYPPMIRWRSSAATRDGCSGWTSHQRDQPASEEPVRPGRDHPSWANRTVSRLRPRSAPTGAPSPCGAGNRARALRLRIFRRAAPL